jgi:hypothetical protein
MIFSRNNKGKIYFALVVFFIVFGELRLSAQPMHNLVPNPSFDMTDSLGLPPRLFIMDPWIDPNGASSDPFTSFYADSCNFCVPYNGGGFQYPRTGNDYAGFLTYSPSPGGIQREYVTTHLLQTLTSGRTYCFTMYLSMPEKTRRACNNVGVYFSVDTPIWAPPTNMPYEPQISNDTANHLIDTANWMPVQGSFVANGDERVLTIGNFLPDSLLSFSFYPPGPGLGDWCYYWVDDVSLFELRALEKPDTLICPFDGFPQTLKAYAGYNSYLWNTGDTSRTIVVNVPGQYWVTASNWCGTVTDTIEVKIFDTLLVQNLLGSNKSICAEQFPYSLSPLQNNGLLSNYVWSTGSNSEQIQVNEPGTYWLSNTYYCGTVTDSITVNLLPSPNLNLGSDTTLCLGQQLQLSAPDSLQYFWSNGSNNKTIVVDTTANITLLVLNQFGCSNKDSIQVIYEQAYNQFLPNDTTLIAGYTLSIEIPNNLNNILWNDGSNAMQRNIAEAGLYFVRASDENNCLLSDSVMVNFSAINLQMPGIISKGDFFVIRNLPPGAKLEVFNSLGQLVFLSDAYQNEWQPNFGDAVFLARLTTHNNEVFISKFVCFGK